MVPLFLSDGVQRTNDSWYHPFAQSRKFPPNLILRQRGQNDETFWCFIDDNKTIQLGPMCGSLGVAIKYPLRTFLQECKKTNREINILLFDTLNFILKKIYTPEAPWSILRLTSSADFGCSRLVSLNEFEFGTNLILGSNLSLVRIVVEADTAMVTRKNTKIFGGVKRRPIWNFCFLSPSSNIQTLSQKLQMKTLLDNFRNNFFG